MLLQETPAAESDGDDGMKHLLTGKSSSSSIIISATVRRFIGAAFNTKSLAKPPYIVKTGDKQLQKSRDDAELAWNRYVYISISSESKQVRKVLRTRKDVCTSRLIQSTSRMHVCCCGWLGVLACDVITSRRLAARCKSCSVCNERKELNVLLKKWREIIT